MIVKSLDSSPGRGAFDPLGFAVTAVLGSLVSVAVTGFIFGTLTNVHSLAIVAALYDEPQFAQDAFIQSLRYFAAGPWLLLGGADRYIDPYWLFLGLHYLSRLLAFIGFLACADLLGIRSRKERALFAGLLCLSALVRHVSYAGEGELFNNYYSHSETAVGLTLIALYFAIRGRLTTAFGVNGAVFFFNAFIAVWNALPLGMIIFYQLLTQKLQWRKALTSGVIGLLIFIVLSAPVIGNILSNPEFGSRTDFDIITYYNQYFPYHFLFEAASIEHKIGIASVGLLAVLSLVALGSAARPFLLALFGYMAIYLFGMVAPYFTHNASVLNLHLLRAGAFFHFLAALGTLTLAIQWLTGKDRIHARVLAPVLIVLVSTSRILEFAAPLPVLASLIPRAKSPVPSRLAAGRVWIGYAAATCIAAWGIALVLVTAAQNRESTKALSEWAAIGQWARASTPRDAIFLFPMSAPLWWPQTGAPPALGGSEIFEYEAHRRVWVDYSRGAAVMWAPSYYRTWWPRFSETVSLTSLDDRIAYARRKAINYVVDSCGSDQKRSPLFRTERLCVYSVAS